MRVLIIGAGPTGLTAAVELARQGLEAHVIDRRDNQSTWSRAVGIIPKSLELLEPSGVTGKLLAEATKLQRVCMYRNTTRIFDINIRPSPDKVQYGHDYILGLAQDRTESILADVARALGATIDYGVELKDLYDDGRHVTATVSTGPGLADFEYGKYDYLIGADGIKSTVRESLGLDYPGFELPETWSIADVDSDDWQNAGAATICQLPKGKVAVVVPLEAARYRVISNTEDALKALPLKLNVKTIRREGSFKIHIRQVEQYSKGRVYLAGDAAHCHSPVGGRGMNLGIADACDLAERMVEGNLTGYSDARHEEGKRVIGFSESARKTMTSSNPFTRLMVRVVLKTVQAFPTLQRRVSVQVLYG